MHVNRPETIPVTVPVLETERLRLRGFARQDVEDYFALVSDPDVVHYVGAGLPLSREQAWQSLAYLVGHWQLLGFGLWAVEEKCSGKVIGRVGLYQPEGWPGLELGWMIAKSHWRQGFAYEAASQVLAWCQDRPGKQPLISLIHSENKPSIELAKKLGAHLDKTLTVGEASVLQFAFDLK